MVSSAGSSFEVFVGEESNAAAGGAAGLGTATAAGTTAVARATGVCDGSGVGGAFSFSDWSSCFGDGDALDDFFFFAGVGDFLFAFGVAVADSSDSDSSDLFLFGLGVESSSSAAFFFFFGVGDLCAAGEGVFFGFVFALGRGVGDSSALESGSCSTAAMRLRS